MKRRLNIIITLITILGLPELSAAENLNLFSIARLKYDGGGDWYCDPTSLVNLLEFLQSETGIPTSSKEAIVEPDSREIFNFPYLYLSGHGRIDLSTQDAENLRHHLTSGGFLHVDDNYGLNEHFLREIKKVFPEKDLVEIPYSHPIYHSFFQFPHGLPKIHEHDGKPPRGYGIFHEGNLVVFYTHECDLGDGWEDEEVHNDPPELREQALKMGVNIIVYALERYNIADVR